MNQTVEENGSRILRRLINPGFITSESATVPAQSEPISGVDKFEERVLARACQCVRANRAAFDAIDARFGVALAKQDFAGWKGAYLWKYAGRRIGIGPDTKVPFDHRSRSRTRARRLGQGRSWHDRTLADFEGGDNAGLLE